MPVYVDNLKKYPYKMLNNRCTHLGPWWCHMWSDPEDTLKMHRLASKIGLKRLWFQERSNIPHYDLTPSKRLLAVRKGAIESKLSDWLQKNI